MSDKNKKEQDRNLRMFIRSIGIGADPKCFFAQNERVLIYGCGDVGRALYNLIKEHVCFIGFMDNHVINNPYTQERVYSVGDKALEKYRDSKMTIIVTPTAFFNEVKNGLESWFHNAQIYSIVDLCAVINSYIILREKSRNSIISYIKQSGGNLKFNIAVVGTDYGLLVYLLYMKMCIENTIFIFGSYNIFSDNKICKLEKYADGCIYNVMHDGYFELKHGPEFDIIRSIQNNSYINKDNVYAHDLLPMSLEFIENNITYIDDGIPSHIEAKDAIVKSYVYLRDDIRIILGKKNDVLDKEKIIEIDLKNEWNKLSKLKKQELLDIFDVNDEIQSVREHSDKYLFLTSGYSASGLMSKDKEIYICKQLMSEYDENDVIIKPHPADTIDYKGLFPDSTVISAKFPFELFWLLEIKLKCVLHFGTSAAMTLFEGKYPEKNYSYLLNNIKLNYMPMINYNDPIQYL